MIRHSIKHPRKFLMLPTMLTLLALQAYVPAAEAKALQHDAAADTISPIHTTCTTFSPWEAGTYVAHEAAETYGIDRCFAADTIDERTFKLMQGKSYKTGCAIPLADLRYLRLLHYTADGSIKTGEIVCHKDIAEDLLYIFRQLFDARYPIERMVLIDRYEADDIRSMTANNTSCFNYRAVAGSRTLSNHSRGKAIDINPLYNPCVKWRNGKQSVSPPSGKPHSTRGGKQTPYRKIDHEDLCYKLFRSRGFRWGGDWRTLKDYQHFEK